jgi:hypothetical protein
MMSPRRCPSRWVLLLLVSTAAAAQTSGTTKADDPLVVTDCSYGDVYQFASVGCTASLENTGDAPLTLSIVSVQPGNTSDPQRLTLAPHARADVRLHIHVENLAGALTWAYRIDGAGKEQHFVQASGFISSVLDVAHPLVDLGQVDPATSPAQTIALQSSLDPNVRVTRIISSSSTLDARIGADAKSLTVGVAPDAPWGPFDENVKLAIQSPQQKQAWVQVIGQVPGEVGPEKNPAWLGEIVRKPQLTLEVPLIDRDARDFAIGKVTSMDFAATYDSSACEPARAGCRNLLIHVADSQPSGLFRSNLDVALPSLKRHLTVAIWGVLGERAKPGEAAVAPKMTMMPLRASQQDHDYVSTTPPLKVQPDPPGTGPLLKWTIGQQEGVHGYQIFRGESADGPFRLMEPRVIPNADNGKGSVAYRWRDTTAVKGRAYWYYIAVLYSSGDRKPLSAPQKTVAK